MAKRTRKEVEIATYNVNSDIMKTSGDLMLKFNNKAWGTLAFEIRRSALEDKAVQFFDKELYTNGIYFLVGRDENLVEKIYVGQAKIRNNGDSIIARLREHADPRAELREKYFNHWNKAIVITSKNTNDWGPTELNMIEHIMEARIPAESKENGNHPNSGGDDEAKYSEIIRTIELYLAFAKVLAFMGVDEAEQLVSVGVSETTTEQADLAYEVKLESNRPVENLSPESRIPEITTPAKVIKAMVDMLPAEVWNDTTVFLDPACKSGEYLREIYDRLMGNEYMKAKYPSIIARSNHILSEQIFGIALSEQSKRRTISLLEEFGQNIKIIPNYISRLKGFDMGTKPDGSQNNIADILNKEFGREMKFDVVIGNPPYQESTDGGKNGGKALWNKFIESAIDIKPTYIAMITPSRWFTGGQGLNQFRVNWINDKHIRKIVHFPNANVVFNGPSIAGGVSYFLWDTNKDDNLIRYRNELTLEENDRVLNKFDIFITNNIEESIVEKITSIIKANKIGTMDYIVGSGGMYGLPTNWREITGELQVITSDGIYYCDIDDIKEKPVGYRVVVSNVMSEHAGESSKDGTYKVITTVQIANPNTVTAGHYIPIGPFNDIDTAVACAKYIKSKTLRLLLRIRAVGIGITTDCYKFIPLQDFTSSSDIDWSQPISNIDQQLYKKYNLTEEEIEYIEKTIKSME